MQEAPTPTPAAAAVTTTFRQTKAEIIAGIPAMRELVCCSICKQVFLKPVTLMCQHTFCLECLRTSCKMPRPSQGAVPSGVPDANMSFFHRDMTAATGLHVTAGNHFIVDSSGSPTDSLPRKRWPATCPICHDPIALPYNSNSTLEQLGEILWAYDYKKRKHTADVKQKADQEFALEVARQKRDLLRTLINNSIRYTNGISIALPLSPSRSIKNQANPLLSEQDQEDEEEEDEDTEKEEIALVTQTNALRTIVEFHKYMHDKAAVCVLPSHQEYTDAIDNRRRVKRTEAIERAFKLKRRFFKNIAVWTKWIVAQSNALFWYTVFRFCLFGIAVFLPVPHAWTQSVLMSVVWATFVFDAGLLVFGRTVLNIILAASHKFDESPNLNQEEEKEED